MNSRTDLALESLDFAKEVMPEGVTKSQETKGNLTVTTIDITHEGSANILGKPIGRYITIETEGFQTASPTFEEEVQHVADAIAQVVPEGIKTALIIGLGNSSITPDALGPQVIRYTLATRHIDPEMAKSIGLGGIHPVSAISPGVLGQTGIETAEIVQALVEQTKPDLVIAVDALASKSIDRLGKTVQISNTGISPGSGVLNKRKELSRQTLGVPVISLGVPTVVDLQTIAHDYMGENADVPRRENNFMVTPREIDTLIEHAAKTIAYAINRTLQPTLSIEDIAALTA